MSCITEKKIPAGWQKCLFSLMQTELGTTSYNDFLLPFFKPCLNTEGVEQLRCVRVYGWGGY